MVIGRFAVFWDYESCKPPSDKSVLLAIEAIQEKLKGQEIAKFTIFTSKEIARHPSVVIDMNKREHIERNMIIEMFGCCLDHKRGKLTLMLITNKDFSSTISALASRNFKTVVYSPYSDEQRKQKEKLNWHDWNSLFKPDLDPRFNAKKSKIHQYALLIEILKELRVKGSNQPLRSYVGLEISTRNSQAYAKAGADGFKMYAEQAEKLGLVQLGGTGGTAWIELIDKNIKLPKEKRKKFTIDSPFEAIVSVVKSFQAKGVSQPLRSQVGMALTSKNPQIYQQLGFDNFKTYAEQAEKHGYIFLGGSGGTAWVSLASSEGSVHSDRPKTQVEIFKKNNLKRYTSLPDIDKDKNDSEWNGKQIAEASEWDPNSKFYPSPEWKGKRQSSESIELWDKKVELEIWEHRKQVTEPKELWESKKSEERWDKRTMDEILKKDYTPLITSTWSSFQSPTMERQTSQTIWTEPWTLNQVSPKTNSFSFERDEEEPYIIPSYGMFDERNNPIVPIQDY
ncbi:hypothetical protein HK103_001579 [Boothiomyces macroporosus]|uniref:NYN domain-containing protein n=1 Tax=Boothiomyces macroporosus TaxID=261099 RepID=A0AAD5Y302_9FUNG|nr:hypothetical protein HK103_001579 [Boothiomyces macroporosus]